MLNTTPEALKNLYVALGGEAEDVADATTSVEILNAISAQLGGEDGAVLNPDAIENIAAVAGGSSGGGSNENVKVTVSSSISGAVTFNYITYNKGPEITILTYEGEKLDNESVDVEVAKNSALIVNYSSAYLTVISGEARISGPVAMILGECEISITSDPK